MEQQEQLEAGGQIGPSAPPTEAAVAGEAAFPCVRLRGLPFDVNDDEIRLWIVSARAMQSDRRTLAGDWSK